MLDLASATTCRDPLAFSSHPLDRRMPGLRRVRDRRRLDRNGFGSFRIEDFQTQCIKERDVQIGKGVWGKVFSATFHKSSLKCALKCKHHEQHDCKGRGFFHEAEMMCKLRHPFIAKVTFTASYPVPAIAIELLGSLLEESTAVLNVPNGVLRDAFGCALSAMNYLHSVRLAHRDICPRNMVHLSKDDESKGWKLKLVDFDASESLEPSQHGQGSLYYASLIFGGWCRMALDRYALGMSFKEMIENRGSALSSSFAARALVVMDKLMTRPASSEHTVLRVFLS
eukprot:s50_g61.t1